ncbi:hypothetical protein WJX84_011022 [Apatococcus fuscideae]|uniref:Uncharacterized protein n=1 Tax=Apatococcus fuscideae TaxID=2026836 RepID=A0AAW1SVJ0_9CHLO
MDPSVPLAYRRSPLNPNPQLYPREGQGGLQGTPWTHGRIMLLGEAAHPDSFALGRCVAASMHTIPAAPQAYEDRSRGLTSREVLQAVKAGQCPEQTS